MKRLSISWVMFCGWLALCALIHAQPLDLRTLAGYAGDRAVDGIGSTARFNHPHGLAADVSGNIFVADTDNHLIRKISPDGTVATIAGLAGASGSVDDVGSNVRFFKPQGVAVDSSGNIFVADTGNHTIRKIAPGGVVTTVAGEAGIAGSDDGNALNAHFNQPLDVAVDSSGQIYVADFGNGAIRKILGDSSVTTVAPVAGPQSLVLETDDLLYVADWASSAVLKISSGGVVTPWAGLTNSFGSVDATGTNALFYHPAAVALGASGVVYVADTFNHTVRQISSSAAVTTTAGIRGMSGSRDGVGTNAWFQRPEGMVAIGSNLFVADTGNSTIRKIDAAGVVTTFAGSPSAAAENGSRSTARFALPSGISADPAGNLYVADTQNNVIRKVSADGVVSTLAGAVGQIGNADAAGTNALFSRPATLTCDASGNVFVADTGNSTIRKISPNGIVATLAGFAGLHGYVDGTGTNAEFFGPQGVALDGAGDLFVADTLNHAIRKISPAGTVVTIAGRGENFGCVDGTNGLARFYRPMGLVIDASGVLYVADSYNHAIRKITRSGTNWITTTLAGLAGVAGDADGTNGNVRFFQPQALALDGGGNLYVVDFGNHSVRKIAIDGTNAVVSTIAGWSGNPGSADGSGASARLQNPSGIAIDGAGYVYIADSANNTLRVNRVVPPELRVTLTGPNAAISWPALDSGFILESANDLFVGGWTSLGYGTLSGDNYTATNNASSGTSFFRLRKP